MSSLIKVHAVEVERVGLFLVILVSPAGPIDLDAGVLDLAQTSPPVSQWIVLGEVHVNVSRLARPLGLLFILVLVCVSQRSANR